MLRPAVAAANCARAGKASGLDIGRRSPSIIKDRNRLVLRGRPDRVPGRRQAVNDSPKTALSSGGGPNRLSKLLLQRGIFSSGLAIIPDQTPLFRRISKAPRGHYYDDGHQQKYDPRGCSFLKNWLASNGYLTSRRTRWHRRHPVRVNFRGRDPVDADDDPFEGFRHSHQSRPDRDGDSGP